MVDETRGLGQRATEGREFPRAALAQSGRLAHEADAVTLDPEAAAGRDVADAVEVVLNRRYDSPEPRAGDRVAAAPDFDIVAGRDGAGLALVHGPAKLLARDPLIPTRVPIEIMHFVAAKLRVVAACGHIVAWPAPPTSGLCGAWRRGATSWRDPC